MPTLDRLGAEEAADWLPLYALSTGDVFDLATRRSGMADRLMSETAIRRQEPGRRDDATMLATGAPIGAMMEGVQTRLLDDRSMAPENLVMGMVGGGRLPRPQGRALSELGQLRGSSSDRALNVIHNAIDAEARAFGGLSDLRRAVGVQGRTPQQREFDAGRAETQRVLGVIDDALGGVPRTPRDPRLPAPTTDEVLRAIEEALKHAPKR